MQRVFRLVETASLKPMQVKPPDRLVQSVRQLGVVSPVLLAERVDEDGVIELEIVDGNRRVAAAKLAGLAKIPAVVYQQADDESLSAVTVITNTLRSKNIISEWQALDSLRAAGQSEYEIAALTGLTAQSVRTRLRPGSMPPVLRDAIGSGKITPSTAEALARLDASAQHRLAGTFERKGYLERADVEELRVRPEPAPNAGMASVEQPPHRSASDPRADPGMASSPERAEPGDGLAPDEETAPDPRVFIGRLDELLLELARETRAHNLSRAAWIDRTMRAWDLSEDAPG